MGKTRKKLSEKDLLDFLRTVRDRFFPVRIAINEDAGECDESRGLLAEITWKSKRFVFAVESSLQFNPKAIQNAVREVAVRTEQLKVNSLIVTPYLSETQLEYLEAQQVSGIDLCGNGIIIVPGRLLIYRTGNPNSYPGSSPIRNVYRGTSSLVVRSFLLRPEYESSQQLLDTVRARCGKVTLSTVSKVCSTLEEDLIIERHRQGRTSRLRLIQPEKLLDCLVGNYEVPVVRRELTGKCSLDEESLNLLIQNWCRERSERFIRTGTSSVDRYAIMARGPIRRYYCTDLIGLRQRLGESLRETERFPALQFLETDDPTAYFDSRDELDASPIQTYLELNAGDKRERETAVQIREQLLRDIERARRKP